MRQLFELEDFAPGPAVDRFREMDARAKEWARGIPAMRVLVDAIHRTPQLRAAAQRPFPPSVC